MLHPWGGVYGECTVIAPSSHACVVDVFVCGILGTLLCTGQQCALKVRPPECERQQLEPAMLSV